MADIIPEEEVSTIPSCTMKQALEVIIMYFKAGLVPFLKGSPGVGKSQLYYQAADLFKLFVIDIRLATMDVTDLTGFPHPLPDENRMTFLAPDCFPLADTPLPKGYKGFLILFDEINSSRDEMQAASYKIILDRMIHQSKLHPKAIMACAGNLDTDNGVTNSLPTPMQSRLNHIRVHVDHVSWMEWAATHGIDYRIMGWINFRPDLLHSFDPNHDGDTYPCPRTYEHLSKMLAQTTAVEFSPVQELAISGVIGHGAAVEFSAYCKVYLGLPTIDDMVADPMGAAVSSALDTCCAICSLISTKAEHHNLSPLIKYLERLPKEFQVFCVKDLIRRDKTFFTNPAITDWISDGSLDFFA